MDAGCEVSWEHCFEQDCELSAIQHAYNILIDDPEVFASECQNDPAPPGVVDKSQLTARQIVEKVSGVPRGIVPLGGNVLTCFVDVQKTLLYWVVCSWGEGFTGSVVDYGAWPDQKRAYFTLADARKTLQLAYPQRGIDAQIQAGLTDLSHFLLDREWIREQDGAAMRVKRCLIDANWGESTDTIYGFCRTSKHAALLMPSHGRGYGATSTPMAEYKRKRGEQLGHNWRLPSVAGKRAVRHVVFDSNYWKSFVQARLAIAAGDPGCLALYQPASAGQHQMIADHLTSEYGVEVTAKGRTVTEWKIKPERPDNHFLDCLVGNAVAASMEGMRLPTSAGGRAPKKPQGPKRKKSTSL
jgi:phage terminase large subunit GpA-like protein